MKSKPQKYNQNLTEEHIHAAEEQIVNQSKRIDYYLTEYSIELLAEKMNRDEFVVPAYQREFTWEPTRKSRFIESILMNLPIPFLFFFEDQNTGKLEIVDGSQRLRTIEEYIFKNLKLEQLEKLPLLNGFTFQDLPISRQRKLKNRSIRGIVLNQHADEEARLDLFDRINTGSKNANKAEIRRGVLQGQFLDLVIDLAKNELFNKLAPVTVKQNNEREREELITRFFAYGDGLENYKNDVSNFLFNYTKKMNADFKEHPNKVKSYTDRFVKTMKFIEKNFPNGFRKVKNGKVTPRARYESIAIGCYLAIKERPDLEKSKLNVDDWLNGVDFKEITGADGANVINN